MDKIQTKKNRSALQHFEHTLETDSSRSDSRPRPPTRAVAPRNFAGLARRVSGADSARRAAERLRHKARRNPLVKPIVRRVLRPARFLPNHNCDAADN